MEVPQLKRLCELRGDLSEDMRVRACAVWALNRIDRQAEARFWKDWHVTVTPENPVARGPMRISGEFLLREQPALAGHPVLFHLRDVLPDGTILNVQSGGGTLKDKDSETITFSIDSQAPHAPGQFELEVQVIFSPVLKVPLTIAPATDEPPQFEKR